MRPVLPFIVWPTRYSFSAMRCRTGAGVSFTAILAVCFFVVDFLWVVWAWAAPKHNPRAIAATAKERVSFML